MLHTEKREGLVSEVMWFCVMMTVDKRSKGHFKKPAIGGLVLTLQVYFLTLYSLKQLYYSHSIVSRPDLRQILSRNSLNFTDLWLTHIHFHPSTTLHTDKISHVTSDTRPSCFSACNIENLGMGLGTRLQCTINHTVFTCTLYQGKPVLQNYFFIPDT